MELTDKFNSPDTPKEELYDIVRYRAEKLKNNFGYPVAPYPEDLLNTLGYMNMDMEQNGKAKMFFELTVEYYPNSANANDSMAEYYESQKDYSSALVFAKKAAELNNDEYYKNRLEEIKSKN
jgi:tetratricopeptide (TPR) repeat protein